MLPVGLARCRKQPLTHPPATRSDLLLAVVAVGVGAAAVAVVDEAGGGHEEGAVVVVAGALAVELAGAEVDVRGAVAVDPLLGDGAVRAGVAGVSRTSLLEGDSSEELWREGGRGQATSAQRRVCNIISTIQATPRPENITPTLRACPRRAPAAL